MDVPYLLVCAAHGLRLAGAHKIPGYETHRFVVSLIGDLMFVASFLVLGGDFWDKIRSLFIHRARVQFNDQP